MTGALSIMSAPSSPELHFQAAGAEKNGAIKRILREWKSMQKDQNMYGYQARPSEDDIFEWHFIFHGAPGTDFSGGVYTGRINLPGEYPFKPPEIRLVTPNGRFELNKKICLSISNYHPEHWQPSWDIRTIITALIAFMPSEGGGAIGSLDYPPEDRRKLAISSHSFVHPMFDIADFIANVPVPDALPDIDVKAGNVSAAASPQAEAPPPQNITAAAAEGEAPAAPVSAPAAPAAPVAEPAAPVQAAQAPRSPQISKGATAQPSRGGVGVLEATAVLLACILLWLVLKKYGGLNT